MHFVAKAHTSHSSAQKRLYCCLLTAVILAAVLLSACKAAATPAAAPAATPTQNRIATRAARPQFNSPTPSPISISAPELTGVAQESLAPTDETISATPAITTVLQPTATEGTIFPTPFMMPTTSWYIYNMAADIQINALGVRNVLSISGDNGTADIIIRTADWDKAVQNNAAYNMVKYLATYFGNLDEKGIAALFGGTHFSIYIKSLSPNNQYIIETITPYDMMIQIGQNQVSQAAWEQAVNAQIQMQYDVTVLCTAKPTTPLVANSDTPLLINGWLTHKSQYDRTGQYDPIRYLTASWTDSTGHQYYCAGNQFDSSCQGHSGSVNPGSTITVNVNIEASDGMKFTCQATYSAP